MPSQPVNDSASHDCALNILYQDADVVAIDKPSGLLVHRSRIDVRTHEFAMQKLRDQIEQPVFLVHRLDRPTSGVLLFALNKDAARGLSDQFVNRTVGKSYRAIVRGHTPDQGQWEEALLEKPDRLSDMNARRDKAPQPAITRFTTVGRREIPFSTGKYPNSRYSEVIVEPLTGRKHQIRRHFNHMAHPIVGDTTYGDRRHNLLFRERLGVHRLLLVAETMQFRHPSTSQPIRISAPVGEEFEKARQQLDRFDESQET